ncbi:hypothetical protein C1X64_27490 [Pseudomonas sp. GW456-E7]|nr:hypothetical protein C1X64_27490 [Pseudomonas sp. GW456-E7]
MSRRHTVNQKGDLAIVIAIDSNIFVVGRVLGHSHQLTFMLKKIFDDQFWLIWICALQRNMQVLANTFYRDVLWSKPILTFRKNIFAVLDGLDTNWLTLANFRQVLG